jgi:hypothetical protein
MPSIASCRLLFVLGLSVVLGACASDSTSDSASDSASDPEVPRPALDRAYLRGDVWNDGQAEVAFYRVTRSQDQYGQANPQSFLVGTYLVKHRFSPTRMTKVTDGSGVSAFKYALFYELESGSYQYKRNWVVNARQDDLQPLKQSFTSFDWCSNQYEEMAFPPDAPMEVRERSDDYGNARRQVDAHGVPPAQIPLLVRALDLSDGPQTFQVVHLDGTTVSATAERAGLDTLETPAGARQTERIAVAYDAPVPSLIGEDSDTTETYWRGTGPERVLVQWAGASGRYTARLEEHLRTPYWRENLWTRLERVSERP